MIEHEPFKMTIFGHQRHAEPDGFGGRHTRAGLTVDHDGAGLDSANAEDGLQHFRAPTADQSREPVDLAAANHEVDVTKPVIAHVRQLEDGRSGGMGRGQCLPSGSRPVVRNAGSRSLPRLQRGMTGTDDRRDQLLHIGVRRLEHAGIGAIAKHGDALRNPEHLVQTMRHVDHANAAIRDRANRVEQDLLFAAVSAEVGSSRISTRTSPISALQIGHLPVRERQRANRCAWIERDAVRAEEFADGGHQLLFLTKPRRVRGSRPSIRFAPTDSDSTRLRSW